MSVSIKDFHSAKVAERVAMLMMQKIKSGSSEPSPMLVVRVVGWKSKVHSGRKFMPKLRGTSWFFEVEFSCPISLLLVNHCFLFPSCRLFLFPGKNPCRSWKQRKGYVFGTISYQVILSFILFERQIGTIFLMCVWFSKRYRATQVVVFISTVNEWWPPPTNATNPWPFLSARWRTEEKEANKFLAEIEQGVQFFGETWNNYMRGYHIKRSDGTLLGSTCHLL